MAQRAATAFWIVSSGIFLFQLGADTYKNLSRDRRVPNAFEPLSMDMYEFIRENTPPDSVIVFSKPRAMRMFTNRDAYVATTCSELTRGDYVVINQIAENSQIPANEIDECGLPLQDVFESRRFPVYKILKFRGVVVTAVLTWGCLYPAHAQNITGSLLGKVTDPSGAPVSGAEVTITSTATNRTPRIRSSRS